jgi:hypothetical protein
MASQLKPLVLYAHENGPNPFKIAIALEHLDVSYIIKLWEGGDDPVKGVKGATFVKINENGRVPALEYPNTGTICRGLGDTSMRIATVTRPTRNNILPATEAAFTFS